MLLLAAIDESVQVQVHFLLQIAGIVNRPGCLDLLLLVFDVLGSIFGIDVQRISLDLCFFLECLPSEYAAMGFEKLSLFRVNRFLIFDLIEFVLDIELMMGSGTSDRVDLLEFEAHGFIHALG